MPTIDELWRAYLSLCREAERARVLRDELLARGSGASGPVQPGASDEVGDLTVRLNRCEDAARGARQAWVEARQAERDAREQAR